MFFVCVGENFQVKMDGFRRSHFKRETWFKTVVVLDIWRTTLFKGNCVRNGFSK